jgi:hypothetical protein
VGRAAITVANSWPLGRSALFCGAEQLRGHEIKEEAQGALRERVKIV